MSYVQIGSEQRPLNEATEQWISEQLRRRRQGGGSTCIRVVLNTGALNLALATADCPSAAGVPRQLNPQEQEVVNLWGSRGLNDRDIAPGGLIAFLTQVQRSM